MQVITQDGNQFLRSQTQSSIACTKMARFIRYPLMKRSQYIGSRCETLKTRLKQHLKDPKSTVYKYINNKYSDEIRIEPVVFAPLANKKVLKLLRINILPSLLINMEAAF